MPRTPECEAFIEQIASSEPLDLASRYVLSDVVHAFPTITAYEQFRTKVRHYLPDAEFIAVAGSGNWRFSLNPRKLLTEFHLKSDIDVAVISTELYHTTWEYMRELHRRKWYSIDHQAREGLRRRGQDIYSGFACPTWLPVPGDPFVYRFKSILNKLSGPEVGYREVKMYYFKNEVEMLDYYRRGFTQAKKEISK